MTPKGSFSFSQFLKELLGSSLFAVALSWTFSVIYTPLDTMCNILGWHLYSLLSNKCRWQAGCFYCLPPLRTNLLWGGIWETWPCCLHFSEASILYPQLRIFCAGVIFSLSASSQHFSRSSIVTWQWQCLRLRGSSVCVLVLLVVLESLTPGKQRGFSVSFASKTGNFYSL